MTDTQYTYTELLESCIMCDGTGLYSDDRGEWHCGQCNGRGERWRVICTNPPTIEEMQAEIAALNITFSCPACDDEVDEASGPCAVCHPNERSQWRATRDGQLAHLTNPELPQIIVCELFEILDLFPEDRRFWECVGSVTNTLRDISPAALAAPEAP